MSDMGFGFPMGGDRSPNMGGGIPAPTGGRGASVYQDINLRQVKSQLGKLERMVGFLAVLNGVQDNPYKSVANAAIGLYTLSGSIENGAGNFINWAGAGLKNAWTGRVRDRLADYKLERMANRRTGWSTGFDAKDFNEYESGAFRSSMTENFYRYSGRFADWSMGKTTTIGMKSNIFDFSTGKRHWRVQYPTVTFNKGAGETTRLRNALGTGAVLLHAISAGMEAYNNTAYQGGIGEYGFRRTETDAQGNSKNVWFSPKSGANFTAALASTDASQALRYIYTGERRNLSWLNGGSMQSLLAAGAVVEEYGNTFAFGVPHQAMRILGMETPTEGIERRRETIERENKQRLANGVVAVQDPTLYANAAGALAWVATNEHSISQSSPDTKAALTQELLKATVSGGVSVGDLGIANIVKTHIENSAKHAKIVLDKLEFREREITLLELNS